MKKKEVKSKWEKLGEALSAGIVGALLLLTGIVFFGGMIAVLGFWSIIPLTVIAVFGALYYYAYLRE